jgi:hypothetical protein
VISQPQLTPNQTQVSANRALYQRFMDLPRSERDKMQAEMEALKLWWHFKSHLVIDGNDLGEAKAKAVAVLSGYLGVSLDELVGNKVEFVPYEVFAAKRNLLTDR